MRTLRTLLLLWVIWAMLEGLTYTLVGVAFGPEGAGNIGHVLGTLFWQVISVGITGLLVIASVVALVNNRRA